MAALLPGITTPRSIKARCASVSTRREASGALEAAGRLRQIREAGLQQRTDRNAVDEWLGDEIVHAISKRRDFGDGNLQDAQAKAVGAGRDRPVLQAAVRSTR